VKVEGYYEWANGKAIVRRVSNGIEIHVEIEQLQVPTEYKVLEVLYG
jgi:hypothetical protein